jgi:hypothetical protein
VGAADLLLTADGPNLNDPPSGQAIINLPAYYTGKRIRIYMNRAILFTNEYTVDGAEVTLNFDINEDTTFLICEY